MVGPGGVVRVRDCRDSPLLVHLVAFAGDAPGPICNFHSGGGFHCAILWIWPGRCVHIQLRAGARLLHVPATPASANFRN